MTPTASNEGFSKVRGTAGRTPTIWTLDLGAQYTFKIWKSNLALRADIFNVTNEQRTTTVDQTYNTVNTSPHQNYPYFKHGDGAPDRAPDPSRHPLDVLVPA